MSTLYDSVDYPGHVYADTHPRSLAAVGRLFGLATKSPSSCRTLEIGCGDGANLVAMAYGLPGSEFVGIDLSARAIAKAMELARSVEVANVHLMQADLMAVDPQALGAFDYVVAHGFYSWVPSPVRDRLMEVIARCLAPAGIAFVSYNAYPGFHLRQMLREMLLLHTRGADSPGQAIAGARALAEYLAIGGEGDGLERQVLRSEAERLTRKHDGPLFHDDLAAINAPVWFHEFVAHATRHGLAWLADAGSDAFGSRALPAEILEMLRSLDRITREQYRDFFLCRRFRRSLVVGRATLAAAKEDPRALDVLRLSCFAARSEAEGGEVRYAQRSGATLRTRDRRVSGIMDALVGAWPGTLGLEEVMALAGAHFKPAETAAERLRFARGVLVEALGLGVVNAAAEPPELASRPGPSPRSSLLARRQLVQGAEVTNLWHETVALDDAFAARLLPLLDGTRSRERLALELRDAWNGPPGELAAAIERHLEHIARLALLHG